MSLDKIKINVKALDSHFYLWLASAAALLLTFLIADADYNFTAKVLTFGFVAVFYLIISGLFYLRPPKKNENKSPAIPTEQTLFDPEIEAKLLALEEANQYFGTSLKFSDMFRLIACRIAEIIPHAACALYLTGEKKESLLLAYAAGGDFKKNAAAETNIRAGLIGKTFQTRQPQLALPESNGDEPVNHPAEMAFPLESGGEVYGVFVLYGNREIKFNKNSLEYFKAVGARISPLFLSAEVFENNLTNALTDALTHLPNERAFYMVLENQIAEAQRFRDARPLTILTMDIVKFAEHNRRLGHTVGDGLLVFAADKIKSQLRQMDFLARSSSDEFLAVLPTASDEIARQIIERIEKTFVTNPFEAAGDEKIFLQINFGASSFGRDGESAGQMLQRAIVRKQQSKSETKENKVIWFPKEYVN